MQTEEGTASMDPWSLSLYGMKAPMTRKKEEVGSGEIVSVLLNVGLIDEFIFSAHSIFMTVFSLFRNIPKEINSR
jgi:hypothetical protein